MKETFYGLEDLRRNISLSDGARYSGLRSAISFAYLIEQPKYCITPKAYTSTVLVALLKQEYQTRVHTTGGMAFQGKPFHKAIINGIC